MPMIPSAITTSAPGRICLFGEHQDYLGLPVIAMAVDLRITVTGTCRHDSGEWTIALPDIGKEFCFDPNENFTYRHNRDYLPAAANVLRRDYGLVWPYAFDITVTGNVPINSGTSSSSALQVAWVAFLLAAAADPRHTDPAFIAKIANLSEVCEFGSPGGVMDHVSSAHGGMVWIDTREPIRVERLGDAPAPFILIDSGIAKDTNGVLGDRKALAEIGLAALQAKYGATHADDVWACATLEDIKDVRRKHGDEAATVMEGNIANREYCIRAKERLATTATAERNAHIGALLNAHHESLADKIGVSHPFICEVLDEAKSLGALGGKINGSGCGGSFYVLATNGTAPAVCAMLTRRGLRHWPVCAGTGVTVKSEE